ncbi:hypothetical protein GCM10011512_28520 [Tersicoccus solisilvae]|uniref:Uncharacterized protein n=1 Tax=Tersicoccus solisilvae TaxID=1882339 RepID=A0ABQ1PN61_9MICC|nr:hypothetical protein [Tersicoccus solisilvae]GGC99927.1 hypothetical protein GCM10011512_28520 [Tersicoccus solisilvae]
MSTSASRQAPRRSRRESTENEHRTHSGEGRGVENAVTFVVMFAVFLIGIYLMSFVDHNQPATWWAMPAAILIASLAYFVGFQRPTRKEHAGR